MSNADYPRPLTLSREDLYELVWSKPMADLAADFGISDVGLAKRCKRLHVPVPGRGYWARVAAGQTPHRPKLPEHEPQYNDYSALTVPDPVVGVDSEEGAARDSDESIRSRISVMTVSPAPSILETLPAIKRTAREMKHPQRSELTLERDEKNGPVVDIDVTQACLDRAMQLADTLLRAADGLTWKFVASVTPEDPSPSRGSESSPAERPSQSLGQLLVEGERISFRIEERRREEVRVPTATELAREKREYRYYAPRKSFVPTGALRVVRLDGDPGYGEPTRRSWYDRKGRLVEEQVRDILIAFHELALEIKARRAKKERRERELAEQERLREELERRQEANAKLVDQLERDAGAWHRARFLRRYVRAVRTQLGSESVRARFGAGAVDFLEWAEEYVDQLDPLHSLERSDDFEGTRSTYFRTDEQELKASIGRLIGADWMEAWKIGVDYSSEPEPSAGERLFSYREKSVFEMGEEEQE